MKILGMLVISAGIFTNVNAQEQPSEAQIKANTHALLCSSDADLSVDIKKNLLKNPNLQTSRKNFQKFVIDPVLMIQEIDQNTKDLFNQLKTELKKQIGDKLTETITATAKANPEFAKMIEGKSTEEQEEIFLTGQTAFYIQQQKLPSAGQQIFAAISNGCKQTELISDIIVEKGCNVATGDSVDTVALTSFCGTFSENLKTVEESGVAISKITADAQAKVAEIQKDAETQTSPFAMKSSEAITQVINDAIALIEPVTEIEQPK